MNRKDRESPTPVERRLDELSDIEVRYFTVPMPFAEHVEILIVSFDGEYRQGARGNKDAAYMIAMIRAGLTAWLAFGLIENHVDLQIISHYPMGIWIGDGLPEGPKGTDK